MADLNLKAKVTLQDDASKPLASLKKQIGDLLQTQGVAGAAIGATLGGGVTAVAGTLVKLVADGAQAAWELGEMGAQAQRTEASFERLAASAGASGRAMLAAMEEASRGTVAETDLMAAANRALVLGVADSAEEMGRLVEAAIVRGRDVGVGATQAVNDLVTGIGRMSPQILDNLGIVGAAGAFDEYARSLGVTAEQLTDVQKKQALLNSVLASTEGMSVADDAAGSFERMDAALSNAKSALGELFSPAVAAIAQTLADTVNEVMNPQTDVGQSAQLLGGYFGMMGKGLGELGAQAGAFGDALAQGLGLAAPSAEQLTATMARLRAELATAQQVQLAATLRGDADAAASLQVTIDQLSAGLAQAHATFIAVTAAGAGAEAQMKAGGYAYAALAGQAASAEAAERRAAEAAALMARYTDAATDASKRLGGAMSAAGAAVDTIRDKLVAAAAGAMGASRAFATFQQYSGLGEQVETLRAGLANLGYYDDAQIDFLTDTFIQEKIGNVDALIGSFDKLGAAAGGVGSAVADMQSDLQSSLSSLVGSQLSGALTLDVSWPGMEGPRQDDVNENARRLAAIANEGLIGQDWLGQFAQEAPTTYADLMLKIAEGMDAQGAAQLLLGEFQSGLRPDLLNFDMIKQQVKDQLTSQQAIEEMTGELTSQLMAEMGVSADQVQGAMGQLGLTGGALGSSGGEAVDLSVSGGQAAASFSASFVSGVNVAGMAGSLAGRITAEFATSEAKAGLRGSAEAVATFWSQMFTGQVASDTPGELLSILTDKLLPLMLAALAQQHSTTRPSDG